MIHQGRLGFLLILIIILQGCGTGGLKIRAKFRENIKIKNYKASVDLINKEKFYQDEDVKLLKFMELGMLNHYMKNFKGSIQYFQKAKRVADELYTKSLSKKAITLIANDNFDQYYGQRYERSLIHFYLALNHFLLFQKGNYREVKKDGTLGKEKKLNKEEKQRELQAARAEVLAWDSYLTSQKEIFKGKSVFKNDLMAKIFGAFIHESIGTRNDDQVALQLYKDANTLLFRNYNGYPSMNKNSAKFKEDFSKLPELKMEEVEKKYVQRTEFQNELVQFIQYKVLKLTQDIRSNDFENQVKILRASEGLVKKVKSENKKRSNLAILIQEGLIPEKKAVNQYYSLEKALTPKNPTAGSKAAAKIGAAALMTFAGSVLGLIPKPGANPVGHHLGIRSSAWAGEGIGIEFEVPMLEHQPLKERMLIQIEDMKGKLIRVEEVPVIGPIADIAEEAVAETSSGRFARLGGRLAVKYLTAIAASYGTYQAVKESAAGELLAGPAALASFYGFTKAIAATEKADTRYWSSLPYSFRWVNFQLPKGKYRVKAYSYISSKSTKLRNYNLGVIEIKKDGDKKVLSFHSPN